MNANTPMTTPGCCTGLVPNTEAAREVYEFGAIKIDATGLSFLTIEAAARRLVGDVPVDQLYNLNREAWRQRKAAQRAMARTCNITTQGDAQFADAQRDYAVAKAVCDATWARMAP